MSHVAASGSIDISTNTPGKYLGVKKFAGEEVRNGNLLVRQRGTVFHAGKNTKVANDHTIYATSDGIVKFRRMTGHKRKQFYVDVEAAETK